VLTFLSLWIDKGVCLVVSGFMPSPLGTITRYVPTLPESLITVAVWAVGALMITVFYKIALSVRASGLALPVEHGTTAGDSPPY
jgi:molybdopterin-containing oxidoreductase family membrane subunit